MRTKVDLQMCKMTSVKEGESLSFVSRNGYFSFEISNAKTVQMDNNFFQIFGEVSKNDCMKINMRSAGLTNREGVFDLNYDMAKSYAMPDEWADVDFFRAQFAKGFEIYVYVPDYICIKLDREKFELPEEREIRLMLADMQSRLS